MASSLIRKVWESSSNSSSSSSGATSSSSPEILTQIVKLVGPKAAAKLSVVSKAWRSLVADDHLWIFFLQTTQQQEPYWDSIVFSETYLRSGYAIRPLWARMPQLPLKSIYSQRLQVPGAIIIDGGSVRRSVTFLEFGNVESPMYSRLRHFFGTIYSRMQVKPNLQPVIVSIPICHYDNTESAKASREQLQDAIYRVLFDMNVPAVWAINQATLALYVARKTSGIVVNIGFQVTSVVPILNGKVMHEFGVEVMGLGALKLTGFLRELMQQNNINFDSLYTIRTIKEMEMVGLLFQKSGSKQERSYSSHNLQECVLWVCTRLLLFVWTIAIWPNLELMMLGSRL